MVRRCSFSRPGSSPPPAAAPWVGAPAGPVWLKAESEVEIQSLTDDDRRVGERGTIAVGAMAGPEAPRGDVPGGADVMRIFAAPLLRKVGFKGLGRLATTCTR